MGVREQRRAVGRIDPEQLSSAGLLEEECNAKPKGHKPDQKCGSSGAETRHGADPGIVYPSLNII
jgi:hypothetical protein